MARMAPEMQFCIDAGLRCDQACLGTVSNPCLSAGGKHVEPEHIRLMPACAEICRTMAAVAGLATVDPVNGRLIASGIKERM
jgi:hypothetical protein